MPKDEADLNDQEYDLATELQRVEEEIRRDKMQTLMVSKSLNGL